MKVLDLFSGMEGWSAPFKKRGHEVITLDNDPKFGADITTDILKWRSYTLPWQPDIILASPPCEGFSVMRIGVNWTRPTDDPPHAPKTAQALLSVRIVERTRDIIARLDPQFFVIENPVAKLRKLPVVEDLERRTVHYCHYGEKRMKPTDLWGGFPSSLQLRPLCHSRGNGRQHAKDCCCTDHNSAPRGSITGSQGMTRAMSGKIPYQLALAVCKAAERDIKSVRQGRDHL